ncbi:MAG: hypothetical protein ACYDDO_07755 [Acidiferrobacterales bacterium]
MAEHTVVAAESIASSEVATRDRLGLPARGFARMQIIKRQAPMKFRAVPPVARQKRKNRVASRRLIDL